MHNIKLFFCAIFLFFVIVPKGQSQTLYNNVGHVPESHQQTWFEAGLYRDMSTVLPIQEFIIEATPGSDLDSLVENAISDANDHVNLTGGVAVIYFPPGNYELEVPIHLTESDSNIVFQGAGAGETFLTFMDMWDTNCFSLTGDPDDTWIAVTQSLYKGTSMLYTNPNGFSGCTDDQWVHFFERNFNYTTDGGNPIEKEIVGQITRFRGRSSGNSAAEIRDVASMDYYLSKPDTDLRLYPITPIRNIGIENLTIRRSPNTTASVYAYNIRFDYAVNCWIRGVESYKPSRSHLAAEHSSHLEISGCYFHEAMGHDGGGYGYGVSLTYSSTNCLVENNIFRYLRHALVVGAGSNCNV